MAHDFLMIVSIGSFGVNVSFLRRSHNDTRNNYPSHVTMIMTITCQWHELYVTVGICLLN